MAREDLIEVEAKVIEVLPNKRSHRFGARIW